MGFFDHLLGRVKQVARGPLRTVVEHGARGILENLTKAVYDRLPHNRLSEDALAALQSTLQIQLPEFGAQLVGAGVEAAGNAAADRISAALAATN